MANISSTKSNGITKKTIHSSKTSDRRLAGGKQPAYYLHNAIVNTPPNVTKILSGSPKNTMDSHTKTVKRIGGGKEWEDSSLIEWDPKHFRLFVGNLGPDASDELLVNAFGKYETLSKVKVPIDTRTGKNKGYGFVAFESADDYLKAFKEMNGKYIGQHPVQLKRAETQIRPVKKSSNRRK